VQRGEDEIEKNSRDKAAMTQSTAKAGERDASSLDVEMNGLLFRKLFSKSFEGE
jgi:hypothetical protein